MLTSLNFVRGAVALKDLIPVLQSVHSYNGRLQGSNGRLTLDAPCKGLENFTVPCAPFLKAVDACQGEPKITLKDDGSSMSITKGKFKAILPLSNHSEFPRQDPAGEAGVKLTGHLLPSLRILRGFVSEDASRPWACGVLFRDGYAYATNNIVVAGVPAIKFEIPLNLPAYLIDELLRIGQEPLAVVACENSITFQFSGTAWLKASLLSAEWPAVEKMLPESAATPVLVGLLSAVEQILPFCPDSKQLLIFLGPDGVKTSDGDKSAVMGGFELPEAVYRAEPLQAVLKAATHIDFDKYPAPAPFVGKDGLRGLLVGVSI